MTLITHFLNPKVKTKNQNVNLYTVKLAFVRAVVNTSEKTFHIVHLYYAYTIHFWEKVISDLP